MVFNPVHTMDSCEDASEYYYSSPMLAIEGLHILACVLSIIITFLFYFKCNKYFYFHRNCTMLIRLVLGTNILHGLSIGGTQVYHILRHFAATAPCDVLIPNRICYFLRFPAHISMCIYVYVQAAIAIERFIAVCFSKNYEKHRSIIGHILVASVTAFSISAAYISLIKWDLDSKMPYCSNVNPFTYKDMYIFICFVNTGITVVSFAAFLIARFYNIYIIKKKRWGDSTQRYQINENETVFNIWTPEISFHFVFSLIYAGTNAFSIQVVDSAESRNEFREYLAGINTIPYYSFLSPLFMWFILHCQRKKRHSVVQSLTVKHTGEVTAGIYFSDLKNQWK